jgi:hypothetical protein
VLGNSVWPQSDTHGGSTWIKEAGEQRRGVNEYLQRRPPTAQTINTQQESEPMPRQGRRSSGMGGRPESPFPTHEPGPPPGMPCP